MIRGGVTCLGAMALLSLIAASAFAAPPLSLTAVETLLKSKVSQQRIMALLKERKASVNLTRDTVKKLKALGASPELVEAIERNALAELSLASEPAGAEVFIDGRYKGKTPLHIADVRPGVHELQVGRVEGYAEYAAPLELGAGRTERSVVLVRRGDRAHELPAPREVPAGQAGSAPAQAAPAPVPEPGSPVAPEKAPPPAPPAPGAPAAPEEKVQLVPVSVRTEPVKAELFLDQRYIGVTPLNFLAAVGSHQLKLVPMLRSKYETVEKEISVVTQGLNVIFLRLDSRRD